MHHALLKTRPSSARLSCCKHLHERQSDKAWRFGTMHCRRRLRLVAGVAPSLPPASWLHTQHQQQALRCSTSVNQRQHSDKRAISGSFQQIVLLPHHGDTILGAPFGPLKITLVSLYSFVFDPKGLHYRRQEIESMNTSLKKARENFPSASA